MGNIFAFKFSQNGSAALLVSQSRSSTCSLLRPLVKMRGCFWIIWRFTWWKHKATHTHILLVQLRNNQALILPRKPIVPSSRGRVLSSLGLTAEFVALHELKKMRLWGHHGLVQLMLKELNLKGLSEAPYCVQPLHAHFLMDPPPPWTGAGYRSRREATQK